MTTNPSQNTDPPSQAPGSSGSPGQAPNQTPSQAGGDSQHQQQSLSQDDIQRVIADLRKENAAHRKKAKEQEEQAQVAEQERLRQAGEYKQLAEQHEKRNRPNPQAQGQPSREDLVAANMRELKKQRTYGI